MNIEEIRKQAEQEIAEEDFREAVNKYKEKLRNKRSLFDWFPYRVVIIKKKEVL